MGKTMYELNELLGGDSEGPLCVWKGEKDKDHHPPLILTLCKGNKKKKKVGEQLVKVKEGA